MYKFEDNQSNSELPNVKINLKRLEDDQKVQNLAQDAFGDNFLDQVSKKRPDIPIIELGQVQMQMIKNP